MDKGAEQYRRFLAGDESGLYEIIRLYKDGLILYINSIVSDMHAAEEIAEDTFVKIFLKRPGFIRGGSFKTWLYTVGKNLALDRLRRIKRNPTLSLEEISQQADSSADIEKTYIRQEQQAILYRALGRLKQEYRQVLWLTYFDGFSHKEAAVILKKTAHGVDTLAYRAKLALKKELEKEDFAYEEFG